MKKGNSKKRKTMRFIVSLMLGLAVVLTLGVALAGLTCYGLQTVVMKILEVKYKWCYAIAIIFVIFVGAMLTYCIQKGKNYY